MKMRCKGINTNNKQCKCMAMLNGYCLRHWYMLDERGKKKVVDKFNKEFKI